MSTDALYRTPGISQVGAALLFSYLFHPFRFYFDQTDKLIVTVQI